MAAEVKMEELTSGASGRIIPLFHKAKSISFVITPSFNFLKKSILIFYSFFLCFLLILLPPSHSLSSDSDSTSRSSTPPQSKLRRRRSREEEEDTLRRRAIAETLEMIPISINDDDDDDVEERESCLWNTSLFFGVRRNALFCRSWFPVSGDSNSTSRSSNFSSISPSKWLFISPRCYCRPPVDCHLHVSMSARNPRKAYWRCDVCKFFDWVGPSSMVWTGEDEGPLPARREEISVTQIEQELVAIREKVNDMVSMKDLIKFGVIMIVLLVVIVKM